MTLIRRRREIEKLYECRIEQNSIEKKYAFIE